MGIAADISLILVFGLLFGALAHRLGQPILLGSIAAGILLGPNTGGITIGDPHDIELLAEIGIALLLFSIGIEFSFKSLRAVRKVALAGTAIQMGLTMGLGWLLGRALGYGDVDAMWLGALISVSSTMVVLKTLAGSGLMGTLSGRVMLGMLVSQDLAVLPLVIVLPQISGPALEPLGIALAIGKSATVLVVLVFAGRRLVPWLMRHVVSWGSRELFVLSVVTLSLGIGYLFHLFGLSYALGAFVAGLVLSQSEFGHQALSDVIPLRDLFGLLFFASVGILFDPGYLAANVGRVALMVGVILVGKGILFGGITWAFGYRNIVPLAAALTMCQIGEFSFLLAQSGRAVGALSDDLIALMVSTTLVTMVLTPYLARLAPVIYKWGWWQRSAVPHMDPDSLAPELRPVVIAGAGRVGTQIARVLVAQGIDVMMIDFDHKRARAARGAGWPVVYGDAAQDPVLHAAGISRALLVLITVPRAVDTFAVASRVRALAPGVPMVVRTESLEAGEDLRKLGGLSLVQPEFEAAMEMVREALVALGVGHVEEVVVAERDTAAPELQG